MKKTLLSLLMLCSISTVWAADTQVTVSVLPSGFNGTSYAANNGDHVLTASNKETFTITTNQIMLNSSLMQWQKNAATLRNKTSLGKIEKIEITATDNNLTVYEVASNTATTGTPITASESSSYLYTFSGDSEWFYIKTGALSKTSEIKIYFKSGTSGSEGSSTDPETPEEPSFTYDLVTGANTLAVGDKLIIANPAAKKAMGTIDGSNTKPYFNLADLTDILSEDGATINLPENNATVSVLTLGKDGDFWTLALPNSKFLSSVDSGNYLTAVDEISDNAKATIEVSSEDATATITFKAGESNTIKYNESSTRYSCYDSSKNKMPYPSLYRLIRPSFYIDFPVFTHKEDHSMVCSFSLTHQANANVKEYEFWLVNATHSFGGINAVKAAAPAENLGSVKIAAEDLTPGTHVVEIPVTASVEPVDGIYPTYSFIVRGQATLNDGTPVYSSNAVEGEPAGSTGEHITIVDSSNASGTTGIDSIATETTDAPAVYFNLHGQRVINPSAGVYLVRKGAKVSKVVIR